ncbi:hypothetical protein ACIPSA_50985 [Streptomyces sp. NPDC086549]|uniref:hypothetical protein n=1 Tax=Streptomyces sp. NPDC086549 TaxID=3365752 RepID=UPI0037F3147F
MAEELAEPWCARHEADLHERRGHQRLRAPGAGPKHELVFTDRVVLTLVHMRTTCRTRPSPRCTASAAPR